MKILHYIPTYAPAWRWGGPVVSTTALCEELAAIGHEVTVYTSSAGLESMPPPVETLREGVHVHYFRREPGMGIYCPAMEQVVSTSAGRFDILHITGIWQRTSPAACVAATAARVPYIISPRGALSRYSWRQKTIKKLAYFFLKERYNLAGAAGFHFTSSMEEDECARFVRGRPHCVIPNGFATGSWSRDQPAAVAWRERYRIVPSTRLLMNIGRIHHKKGLDLLAEALAPLTRADWRLVFVGNDDDGTQNKLSETFTKRGLADRVLFVPTQPREKLPAIYSAADLFLLPSRHENFGNVAGEALACGCPIVISDQVGFGRDVLASGAVKILPRDPAVWTRCINDYLCAEWQPPSAGDISQWALHHFASRKLALEMVAFYTNVHQLFHANHIAGLH